MNHRAHYEIRKYRIKRRRTQYVILVQIRNFHEIGTVIPPIAKLGTYKLTSPVWEYYFCKDMAPKYNAKGYENAGMPYHYFIELVDTDYQITIGMPEYVPSYYIDILINARILPEKYRNAIVIGIKEDFSIDTPELRLWEQLTQKLLVPILLRYPTTMDRQDIVYIDDVIDLANIDELMKRSELSFDYAKALFLDRMFIKQTIDKYATVRT